MTTGRPVKFAWDREEEMQVGAPRGAERWYIKDGLMADGRIVARQFRGYFDAGAYTRLSSYAGHKSTGHLPGPYTIPNVKADVYCVFTNRTPSTAMRGFGITGVDFAIECQMDKLARRVGMNPIEFRMLNAYRDGDMKAHRRVAKNTALIECCQVAAEKAGWEIGARFKAMSSLKDGGGGARGELPMRTATDAYGLERKKPGSDAGDRGPVGEQNVRRPAPPVHHPSEPQPTYETRPTAPSRPAPAANDTPPAADAAKRARTRFSSISGLRRR